MAATAAIVLSDATAAPATWQANNPPSCAVGFADCAKHLAQLAVYIVAETTLCAQEMGWDGWVTIGTGPGTYMVESKKIAPFHSQLGCVASIFQNFASVANTATDAMNMAFVCFNSNQACGQTIATTVVRINEAARDMVMADQTCQKPGGAAPVYPNQDIVTSGLQCWYFCWNIIYKLISMAKNIDVAISVCGTEDAAPAAAPVPVPKTVPEPTAANATAAADVPLAAAPTWSSFVQPQPFKSLGEQLPASGASERRLAEIEGNRASDLLDGLPGDLRAELSKVVDTMMEIRRRLDEKFAGAPALPAVLV